MLNEPSYRWPAPPLPLNAGSWLVSSTGIVIPSPSFNEQFYMFHHQHQHHPGDIFYDHPINTVPLIDQFIIVLYTQHLPPPSWLCHPRSIIIAVSRHRRRKRMMMMMVQTHPQLNHNDLATPTIDHLNMDNLGVITERCHTHKRWT